MKKNIYAIALVILGSFVLLTSCSSDDGGDDKEEVTDQQKAALALKLGSPWAVQSVDSKPDGTSEELLDDFKLSFGTTGESVTLAPSSFSSTSSDVNLASDAGATWKWSGTDMSAVTLEGAFASELTDIKFVPDFENPESITVTFVLSAEGGRKKGMGEYTVTFQ